MQRTPTDCKIPESLPSEDNNIGMLRSLLRHSTKAPRRIQTLEIAVTFHFVEHRLDYLWQVAAQFGDLAAHVGVTVVTNAQEASDQERIRSLFTDAAVQLRIAVPQLLGHPKLLTWCHRAVLKERFEQDATVTHFMYLEDDICVRPSNIRYWLEAREALRSSGLIPSFLRYEERIPGGERYSTDVTRRLALGQLPQLRTAQDYAFLNLPQPYQGMYLLDRELMLEHMEGPSWDPNFGPWGIMEKATQGLTYAGVPPGYNSRNLIGYDLASGQIDDGCLVHHTPNNYTNNPRSKFGKIPLTELIQAEAG